jgi:cobalt/nickel transport system ATP-binding protein
MSGAAARAASGGSPAGERAGPALLEASGVCYSVADGGPEVPADIDLALRAGDEVVLLGANGTGKSTLLKLLNGLLAPSRGEIRYDATAVTRGSLPDPDFHKRFRREVVFLFQNRTLCC